LIFLLHNVDSNILLIVQSDHIVIKIFNKLLYKFHHRISFIFGFTLEHVNGSLAILRHNLFTLNLKNEVISHQVELILKLVMKKCELIIERPHFICAQEFNLDLVLSFFESQGTKSDHVWGADNYQIFRRRFIHFREILSFWRGLLHFKDILNFWSSLLNFWEILSFRNHFLKIIWNSSSDSRSLIFGL
jgi:hypothetical protein